MATNTKLTSAGAICAFKPGETKQHINEADWNIGFTDYIKPRLGITADVRGYYGTAYIGNNPYGIFLPASANIRSCLARSTASI